MDGGRERRKMDRNKEGKSEERRERWARIEREINRIFNSFFSFNVFCLIDVK